DSANRSEWSGCRRAAGNVAPQRILYQAGIGARVRLRGKLVRKRRAEVLDIEQIRSDEMRLEVVRAEDERHTLAPAEQRRDFAGQVQFLRELLVDARRRQRVGDEGHG